MLTIRRLGLDDDLRALVALPRAFFDEYVHWHPSYALRELRDEDIIAFSAVTLGAEDTVTLVAIEGEEIVGYLAASIRQQERIYAVRRLGFIAGLMVRVDRRRRGVASRLFAAARSWFAERGVAQFTLYTAAANETALAFFLRPAPQTAAAGAHWRRHS